jgi:hypothetical protein
MAFVQVVLHLVTPGGPVFDLVEYTYLNYCTPFRKLASPGSKMLISRHLDVSAAASLPMQSLLDEPGVQTLVLHRHCMVELGLSISRTFQHPRYQRGCVPH